MERAPEQGRQNVSDIHRCRISHMIVCAMQKFLHNCISHEYQCLHTSPLALDVNKLTIVDPVWYNMYPSHRACGSMQPICNPPAPTSVQHRPLILQCGTPTCNQNTCMFAMTVEQNIHCTKYHSNRPLELGITVTYGGPGENAGLLAILRHQCRRPL